ncbi:MAG: 3-isopropylmalate dehydrogenase [Hyphomicrobiaceae bacterium]
MRGDVMERRAHILVLPGDGIGPEVVDCGLRVLRHVATKAGIALQIEEDLIGGAADDRYGTFCRNETAARAKAADAILVGAVGGPKWDGLVIEGTPEEKDGLMRLRRELDVFAGLRPSRSYPQLLARTPFRDGLADGADVVVLRELCGGSPFAMPRGIREGADGRLEGFDTNLYTSGEVERIARVGFALAERRGGRLASVEKSNVMESGALWRRVVAEVGAREFPNVALSHLYADNAAYQMIREPRRFDVILADNIFGDLLSDLAAVYAGSLGMLPSASLPGLPAPGAPISPGIYEPVHGSAPDIAGQGIANPLGTILSVGMLLDYGLGRPDLARTIEAAVTRTLQHAELTPDLGGSSGSADLTAAVIANLA